LFLDGASKDVKTGKSHHSQSVVDLHMKLQCQADEIEFLQKSVELLQVEKKETSLARDDFQADWQSSQLDLLDARQQLDKMRNELDMAEEIEHLHRLESRDLRNKLVAQLEEQEDLIENITKATEAERQEVRKLRGERQVLQSLSANELTALAETLMESLLRVQSAQQRKLQEATDERLCAVCLTETKNVVLQPCNHLVMCTACFAKCNDFCPQCRTGVRGHLVVFS
jgi:hypothetical protein